MLSQNHSLKPFNTLGLEINADVILPVTTGEELRKARAYSRLASKPFLLLGGVMSFFLMISMVWLH